MFGSLQEALFRSIHGNNLVYNTCWEDPRLDRQALGFNEDDHVVMITSAGCNALDYLLAGAGKVSCVDINPRQNALLELKVVCANQLDYSNYFQIFGKGNHADIKSLYLTKIRTHLSDSAANFWDSSISFFAPKSSKGSFYFRGSSGLFARAINWYIDRIDGLRGDLETLFSTTDLNEQARIYKERVKPRFWGPLVRSVVGRDLTLAMLGVPKSQRIEIDTQFPGGIVSFIEHCLDAVFSKIPLIDNYFWRLYVFGEYTEQCCPEYLKEANFQRLQEVIKSRLSINTSSLIDFLNTKSNEITKFVLLDHMDWLSANKRDLLQKEWQAIFDSATDKGARCIWRSGGVRVSYVDPLTINVGGDQVKVGSRLNYHNDLAKELHALDRVHTYGSFYIADIIKAQDNKSTLSAASEQVIGYK